MGRFIGRVGLVSLPAVEVALDLDERVVRRHVAKLEAAGWLGRESGHWGEGSVAWLTTRGLAGARLGDLRPVKAPPRLTTVAHGVLVGWSAARVQRRGRPWRSTRELALDGERWAVRVRGELGVTGHRLPDLAVWLHASKPPVAVVVHSGLARVDRQRAILKAWREAIECGQYAGVRYDCTSESVAERVAYLAEKVHLGDEELFVTVQPTRDEIIAVVTGHADPAESAMSTHEGRADMTGAAEARQLTLLPTPTSAAGDAQEPKPAPPPEAPQTERESPLAAAKRERFYREVFGIQEPKRHWWSRQ